MPRTAPLGLNVTILVLGVELLQIGVRHHDRGARLGERAFGVLQAHGLGGQKLRGVLREPRTELSLGRLDGSAVLIECEGRIAHLALFILEGDATADLGRGHEFRHEERALQILVLQTLAHIGAVGIGRNAHLREARER